MYTFVWFSGAIWETPSKNGRDPISPLRYWRKDCTAWVGIKVVINEQEFVCELPCPGRQNCKALLILE